jgi:diguanylate cyclase (GGDEF)-like protein/PAS domain S-box-containing protein
VTSWNERRHAALVRLLCDLRTAGFGDRRESLELILGAVCRYTEWPLGHAYRLDARNGRLRPEMICHEREPGSFGPLLAIAADTSLSSGEDLPGRAMASRTPEWTADISREKRFGGAGAGSFPGVCAAVALPLVTNGAVDIVLEFFCSEPPALHDDVLSVLEHVAVAWGRGVEIERLSVELRAATERQAAAGEFRMHASAAAHARDAIVVSTVGGAGRGPTILYANAAFTRMTGYTEREVLGRSFSVLAGANTSRTGLQDMDQRLSRCEPASTELIAYRKDGQEFLLEWHASPIPEIDGSVQHFASIQRDITDERSAEQALKRADRDALTGLPTREVLEKRIRLSIQQCKERSEYRFALLFLDMDGFKVVNDARGHVVGDQLLASAARRLEGTIRPGDVLARFGGDEFVILLQHVTDTSDVMMVVDRVRERMAAPFEIQGSTLRIAASIGIAMSDPGYDKPEDLVRDADAAMYRAKRKGMGGFEFFSVANLA